MSTDAPGPHRPRRPTLLGPAALDSAAGGADPAERARAAHTTAWLLVEGARSSDDQQVVDRVVDLADEHGLELLADLWADSPADSLPGVLWRLYVLRAWVEADPVGASREFAEGRRRTPVLEVVAGVADPPGPEQVRQMLADVLTGVSRGDLAVTMERAAAFARIVSAGRAELTAEAAPAPSGASPGASVRSAARMLRTAEQLEHAADRYRQGRLT
ncbi:hypothetical protein [Thalassiella azotivora]